MVMELMTGGEVLDLRVFLFPKFFSSSSLIVSSKKITTVKRKPLTPSDLSLMLLDIVIVWVLLTEILKYNFPFASRFYRIL